MSRAIYAILASAILLVSAAPLRALAAPHDFTVYNDASQSIEYVFISPPADNNWGDDWLGSAEVIGVGNTRTFSVALGCSEDVKVEFMDHTSREFRNFDTCQSDLRVTSASTS